MSAPRSEPPGPVGTRPSRFFLKFPGEDETPSRGQDGVESVGDTQTRNREGLVGREEATSTTDLDLQVTWRLQVQVMGSGLWAELPLAG